MPPKKKETEEKIIIRQFKDKSSNWWLNNVHYHLNELGEIIFCAGGIESDEDKEALRTYIKRNKKVFVPREKSLLETVEKEYNEIIRFGKYSGKSVSELFFQDKRYLEWVRDSYSFKSGEEKLKQEITEILK